MTRAMQLLCLVFAALIPIAVPAQGMSDPTKPPSAEDLASFSSAGLANTNSEYRLEAVILSVGRKLAVINGQTVPLGKKIGEARLIRVSEGGAVIRKGAETETLRFHAGVEKSVTKRRAIRHAPPRSDRAANEEAQKR